MAVNSTKRVCRLQFIQSIAMQRSKLCLIYAMQAGYLTFFLTHHSAEGPGPKQIHFLKRLAHGLSGKPIGLNLNKKVANFFCFCAQSRAIKKRVSRATVRVVGVDKFRVMIKRQHGVTGLVFRKSKRVAAIVGWNIAGNPLTAVVYQKILLIIQPLQHHRLVNAVFFQKKNGADSRRSLEFIDGKRGVDIFCCKAIMANGLPVMLFMQRRNNGM